MPIYDNDGTANREIGTLYDNNGSANTQIGKVYDYNGSANSLIYQSELIIYPGSGWQQGWSAGGSVSNNGSTMILTAAKDGGWCRVGYWLDVTPYSTMTISLSYTRQLYGYLNIGLYPDWPNNTGGTPAKLAGQGFNQGGTDSNYAGTYTYNISGVNRGCYAVVHVYAGSAWPSVANLTSFKFT